MINETVGWGGCGRKKDRENYKEKSQSEHMYMTVNTRISFKYNCPLIIKI